MSPRPPLLLATSLAVALAVALAGCAGDGALRPGPGGAAGGGGAGPGAGGAAPAAGPAAHGSPLPTTAVDPSLFPKNDAARRRPAKATFYVAPGGSDAAPGSAAAPFRTIRRAIEAAAGAAPARVVVGAGTYAEGDPANDDHALRIEADGTVVETPQGERAVVRPADPGIGYGLEIAASGVTLAGLSFEGFASNAISIGVDGRTCRDIVIADCRVVMRAGGDGIAVYPDARASGVPVVDGLLLERVSVAGADLGITVGAGPVRSVALRQVEIHNRATPAGNSGADAIGFESGDNVLVDGAEVTGTEGDGIDLKTTRTALVNVYVHDVLRNGIKLWLGGDIVNALVHDCGADASIVLGPAERLGRTLRYRLVASVIAFHNRRQGGAAAYAMTVGYDAPLEPVELEIADTLFYRNAGGIALSKGTRTTVRRSLFFGTAGGRVVDYAWDGAACLSIDEGLGVAALARIGQAAGNLPFGTDPKLADRDASSIDGFRPGPASPLVDAGEAAAPFPAVDLLGTRRVQGAGPDLGPIEAR
jgi:hypothetical protein